MPYLPTEVRECVNDVNIVNVVIRKGIQPRNSISYDIHDIHVIHGTHGPYAARRLP
jgi:hypothetical protein